MIKSGLLIAAMAQKCREVICKKRESKSTGSSLPKQLRAAHILWMCDRIEAEAEIWSIARLHRWIGFVQCAMIANGFLDFAEAKTMFEEVKNAYGENNDDLADHLDTRHSFELEIGGEG